VCNLNYFGDICKITKCFDFFSNDSKVCNSNGNCNNFDKCSCNSGINSINCAFEVKNDNIGAIIGGVLGGVGGFLIITFFICLIIALIFILLIILMIVTSLKKKPQQNKPNLISFNQDDFLIKSEDVKIVKGYFI
jgi:hypothetical protein